jgi:hypothetical protein
MNRGAAEPAEGNAEIDILIVVDTAFIKSTYPNPSQDPNCPTGIAHMSNAMFSSDLRGVLSGQGTADLRLRANGGDTVRLRAMSVDQNSDTAVIAYGVRHWAGDAVFDPFLAVLVGRQRAVMPDVTTPNGLPPVSGRINFTYHQSTVRRTGMEAFFVNFALYTTDPADDQAQKLFGYFYWDPTVVVE